MSEGRPITDPVRLRIQITTKSDWATVTLQSGGTLINPAIVSASTEATNRGANDNRFYINQTIERAISGASAELVVDAFLSEAQSGGQLAFVIESGAIGDTSVTLFNYLQDTQLEAITIVLNETSKTFDVPVEMFFSS